MEQSMILRGLSYEPDLRKSSVKSGLLQVLRASMKDTYSHFIEEKVNANIFNFTGL